MFPPSTAGGAKLDLRGRCPLCRVLGLSSPEVLTPRPRERFEAVVKVVHVCGCQRRRRVAEDELDIGEHASGEFVQTPDRLERSRGLSHRASVDSGRRQPSDNPRLGDRPLEPFTQRSGSQPVNSTNRSNETPAAAARLSANETKSTARPTTLIATCWPASGRPNSCIEAPPHGAARPRPRAAVRPPRGHPQR